MNERKILARAIPDKDGYLVDAVTKERIVFYVCDPEKNIGCEKANCRSTTTEAFGFCSSTTEQKYQKDGTRPFYKRLNGQGYYGREYIGEEAAT